MPTDNIATTVTTSKRFSLKVPDFLKGLLVAIITPVFTILYSSLNAGSLTFDWKAIASTAGAAGLAYLLKNYLTPAQTIITGASEGSVNILTIPPAGTTSKATKI